MTPLFDQKSLQLECDYGTARISPRTRDLFRVTPEAQDLFRAESFDYLKALLVRLGAGKQFQGKPAIKFDQAIPEASALLFRSSAQCGVRVWLDTQDSTAPLERPMQSTGLGVFPFAKNSPSGVGLRWRVEHRTLIPQDSSGFRIRAEDFDIPLEELAQKIEASWAEYLEQHGGSL